MQQSSGNSINSGPWLRVAAMLLVMAALGLPVNDLLRYALLLVAAIVICSGIMVTRPVRWMAAIGGVALAALGHWLVPVPLIDEGHNVFIVERPDNALKRDLPAGAYEPMLAEFDATYPRQRRCDPATTGCWRGGGFPDRGYAFSTDGIYQGAALSRRVAGIDFSDPVWQRLGFINDVQYNWHADSDLQRNGHKRPWWMLFHRWTLTMPHYVAYRFPAEFTGSRLCWSGHVLWQRPDAGFTRMDHDELACRTIERGDVGRLIVGVSIAAPLEMTLTPTGAVWLRGLFDTALRLLAVAWIAGLLVRVRWRQLVVPLACCAGALLVVMLNDASFIGGIHPFEGGDDGLAYESAARRIVQDIMAGDYRRALQGGEAVFYYGGPGLRYLRALEHFIFGDTFFGYLSLMLALPFIVYAVLRRFLGSRIALALTAMFLIVPVGAVFGTTFYQYVKWAARGFADPAAAALFIAALVMLVGPTMSGPDRRFQPALGAGFLFALALWLRPNLAPGAAVLLGGAGLAALWQAQIGRLAGLCLGFLPVFGMALHNWIFGGVFVLFSSNATIAAALPMPPSAYRAALGALLRLDFGGEHLAKGVVQWAHWLAGPSGAFVMVPIHLAAIAVLLRVALSRRFDPWLRLVTGAALALHPVAWFYLPYERYHYLAWFLTLLVCAVWIGDEGDGLLRRRFPSLMARFDSHPIVQWSRRVLDRGATIAGLTDGPRARAPSAS